MKDYSRRTFLKQASVASLGLRASLPSAISPKDRIPVGMIGLDTSHSVAFTKLLNQAEGNAFGNYAVTMAYPYGSRTIESSVSRIPKYTREVEALGVQVVDSIDEMLQSVEVVLLETNDGGPHLEQALQVIEAGKPLFVDKPVAISLADAIKMYREAEKARVPIFSASSLRYITHGQEVRSGKKIGAVLGADAYSPASLEPSHPDLFWYGIHGVETLFTVMGAGCQQVRRHYTPDTDHVLGVWNDGRLGTFRGTRRGTHGYGGMAYGETGNQVLGPYAGYEPLVKAIVQFFQTGKPPVSSTETLEIYAFMEAADESKGRQGSWVALKEVMEKAGG